MFTQWFLHTGIYLAYLVYFIIIFAESGILIGFFLPGDSLLITMGLYAAAGHFNILLLLILGVAGAILGDSVGYYFGRKIGPSIFTPDNKRKYLNHRQLEEAKIFYDKYGVKTIILARFTPFVRTFAPIMAGVSEMNYSLFLTYNVIGGAAWVLAVTLLGYFLGEKIPNIDKYILPIIAVIILVTIVPGIFAVIREAKKKA